MHLISIQFGRFWWWVQQSGNSNIVLVAITAWYAILTHWIMRSTAKQAHAALQPALSLCRFARKDGEEFHTILIQNSSGRPVVFLDVVISCHRHGQKPIVHKLREWDDQILAPDGDSKLPMDFSRELKEKHIHEDSVGYQAVLVVSDLSRQVAIEYEFFWVMGRFTGKAGMPWRVSWRYRLRPWGWRYNRVKYWLRDRFKRKDE